MTSFADNLVSVVHHTFVGFALSVCKDVGILEVLFDSQKPLTSQEIADNKDLKESKDLYYTNVLPTFKYVRELLASLATAEVVHVSTNESGALVYHLDEDEKTVLRSMVLTLISGPVVMSPAYDTIKSCVRNTGARFSSQTHDFIESYTNFCLDEYVDNILKHVDGLKEKLERGFEAIEFGCGRGRLTAKRALMFPMSTFTATDNESFLLDDLNAKLGHIPNIKYDVIDLCSSSSLPSKQYDWVFCANVIHDVSNPPEALNNIRKVMKVPGGTFTMIATATSGSPIDDRGNPLVATMYTLSSFFCVPESYTGGDSHVLGMCCGKQRAFDFVTAAGFKVNAIDLTYPVTLFVCE